MHGDRGGAGHHPRHVKAFEPYSASGFDEVYVANMGPHYRAMIRMYAEQVLPELHRSAAAKSSH